MNMLSVVSVVIVCLFFIILWSWILFDGIQIMFNFIDFVCSFFRKKQTSISETVIKMIENKKGKELLVSKSFYRELIKNDLIYKNHVFGVEVKVI